MPASQPDSISRFGHRVPSDPGIEIAVREVRPHSPTSNVPILLIHGGGGGGIASFDLPLPGYSLAEDLAGIGRIVLVIDLRGWGTSTRPPELDRPPADNPPSVSSEEACRDITAVADWAADRFGTAEIDLFGWATGGHWAGMWAALHADRARRLASLNALYGVDAPWAMQAGFADRDDSTRFNPAIGAYGVRNVDSLLRAWNQTIPIDNKYAWRDPAVAETYARLTIESDPTHLDRDPPSVRTPTGFQRDSFRQSHGHRFWEASAITADVLIIRGDLDFWSRPEDVDALAADLTNARSVEVVRIPDGTHFAFIDRPERGRKAVLDALNRLFSESD